MLVLTQEKTEKMPRGRKPKAKPPTKGERTARLMERILQLPTELVSAGLGNELLPPDPILLIHRPLKDPKTGGWVGHVEEPLGSYIQRVSIKNNVSQRPPFDHTMDPIYRRLIRDFIEGATMPESKVVALQSPGNQVAQSLEVQNLKFSVVDGLQRLYCFCIALLLALRREDLAGDGCISKDAWEEFAQCKFSSDDRLEATRELLRRTMRYEIFYGIGLSGLLHYMVTFNTGQRRMSLPVQLEIMRRPLIDQFEQANIQMFSDIDKLPGQQRPKDKFAASDLALATEAFLSANPQLTATEETERFLNENQAYLDDVGEIEDVVTTLAFLATKLQPAMERAYADDSSKRYILSGGGIFLVSLAAACGKIRQNINMKALEGMLERLLAEFKKFPSDPMNLEDYQKVLSGITSSRGKNIRRLVYDTFLRFFNGTTHRLDWTDTARQFT
jgi:hypothetical protein